METTLGPFEIESYEQVLALWQQSEGVGLSDADSKAGIDAYLNRNPGMSFIATTGNGRIAGAILAGHDGRRGYIHHLSVHADFRRRGISSKLVGKSLRAI